jgi:adenine-specific DNA methylase
VSRATRRRRRTWAALNIVGGGPEIAAKVQAAQKKVFDAVDAQVTKWGIEHDDEGRRADAYLYCNEVTCPECGWKVPLAPSWVIGEKSRAIAVLVADEKEKRFDLEIQSDVSDAAMKKGKASGTAVDGLRCPSPVGVSTSLRLRPQVVVAPDRRARRRSAAGKTPRRARDRRGDTGFSSSAG